MIAKEGVDLRWLSPPAWHGVHIADQLHRELAGRDVVVTSTGEGKHSVARSAHYCGGWLGMGRAFDLRIWHLGDELETYVARLREQLGEDYVVLLEKTHVHVHWAPVWREL